MKKIFFISLAALLLTGCGVRKEFPAQEMPNEAPPAATPQKPPAASKVQLKMYHNARYGYMVEYPADWFVDTSHAEDDYTLRPSEGSIGGDVIFANYQNPTQFNPGTLPSNLYAVNMMIYKSDGAADLDAFIANRSYKYDKKEELMIGSLKAVRLTSTSENDHPVGTTVVLTLIQRDDQVFVFNYSGNPIPEAVKPLYETIVMSFMPMSHPMEMGE